MKFTRYIRDILTINEEITSSLSTHLIADTLAISDSVIINWPIIISMSDTLEVFDRQSFSFGLKNLSLSDSLIIEEQIRRLIYQDTVTDSLAISENIEEYIVNVSDGLEISEAIIISLSIRNYGISDTVNIREVIGKR